MHLKTAQIIHLRTSMLHMFIQWSIWETGGSRSTVLATEDIGTRHFGVIYSGTFPHDLHYYLFRIGTGLHIFIGLFPNMKSTLHPSYSCSVWVNHPYQLCHITRSGESTKHQVEWISAGMVVCENANRKHKICSLPVLEQCNPQSEEGVWVSTHRCCLVTWGCHTWEDGRSDGSKWWETAGSLWQVNIVPNTA